MPDLKGLEIFIRNNHSLSSGLSPGKRHIDVYENNHFVGSTLLTFLSKMDDIDSLLYDVNNPQELLCQVLRVDNPADLDLELCDRLTNGKQNVESLQQLGNVSPSATGITELI